MSITIECDGTLSDLVLQAARQAIPADYQRLITLPASSAKNQPLMPLLVALIDATQQTAQGIGDNAWDDCLPLNQQLAVQLAAQCRAIAADIENAAQAPNRQSWSLPSMTGKELI
jgi:hypothetical protein